MNLYLLLLKLTHYWYKLQFWKPDENKTKFQNLLAKKAVLNFKKKCQKDIAKINKVKKDVKK